MAPKQLTINQLYEQRKLELFIHWLYDRDIQLVDASGAPDPSQWYDEDRAKALAAECIAEMLGE